MKVLLEKMVQDRKKAAWGTSWAKKPWKEASNMALALVGNDQGGKAALPKLAASTLAP